MHTRTAHALSSLSPCHNTARLPFNTCLCNNVWLDQVKTDSKINSPFLDFSVRLGFLLRTFSVVIGPCGSILCGRASFCKPSVRSPVLPKTFHAMVSCSGNFPSSCRNFREVYVLSYFFRKLSMRFWVGLCLRILSGTFRSVAGLPSNFCTATAGSSGTFCDIADLSENFSCGRDSFWKVSVHS